MTFIHVHSVLNGSLFYLSYSPSELSVTFHWLIQSNDSEIDTFMEFEINLFIVDFVVININFFYLLKLYVTILKEKEYIRN